MFRHQGKSRTLKHNLRIATILSFVAGIVNVSGFLAFHEFATHVTGHFAQFMRDVAEFNLWIGTIYLIYIVAFLFGSFSSSFLIEKFKENKKLNVYVIPTVIECVILIAVAVWSNFEGRNHPTIMVSLLLFAMGLQNSFVTKISNAVVRTTHLTGTFTDLGIDLSQLFFPRSHPNQKQLKSTIKLRLFIIGFFFSGGIVGGFLYSEVGLKLNTLFLSVLILITSLLFDEFRVRAITVKRRLRRQKKSARTITKKARPKFRSQQ